MPVRLEESEGDEDGAYARLSQTSRSVKRAGRHLWTRSRGVFDMICVTDKMTNDLLRSLG